MKIWIYRPDKAMPKNIDTTLLYDLKGNKYGEQPKYFPKQPRPYNMKPHQVEVPNNYS